MARPNKRKLHIRELAKERKRKHHLKDSDRKIIQEEHGWESSEVEEDATPIRLQQQCAGSVSDESKDSEDDGLEDVLVSEGEELEEVDESVCWQCWEGEAEGWLQHFLCLSFVLQVSFPFPFSKSPFLLLSFSFSFPFFFCG